MENFIFCAVTVILKIQQILGSCKLNKWPHLFLTTSNQESSEIIASFCFIPSILFWEMQSILESRDQTCHKHFWSFFDLCGFLSTCKKNRLFYWFVLEIWLIKKFCNLIGWEHFGPYLWDKRIPWDLCRNTANNKNFHYRTNSVKTNDQIFQ